MNVGIELHLLSQRKSQLIFLAELGQKSGERRNLEGFSKARSSQEYQRACLPFWYWWPSEPGAAGGGEFRASLAEGLECQGEGGEFFLALHVGSGSCKA